MSERRGGWLCLRDVMSELPSPAEWEESQKKTKLLRDAEHYTYRRKSKAPGDSTKEGWVCTHSQCSARATTAVKDGITWITALTVSMVLNGEQIHKMYMYITKKYLNAHILYTYIPKY